MCCHRPVPANTSSRYLLCKNVNKFHHYFMEFLRKTFRMQCNSANVRAAIFYSHSPENFISFLLLVRPSPNTSLSLSIPYLAFSFASPFVGPFGLQDANHFDYYMNVNHIVVNRRPVPHAATSFWSL